MHDWSLHIEVSKSCAISRKGIVKASEKTIEMTFSKGRKGIVRKNPVCCSCIGLILSFYKDKEKTKGTCEGMEVLYKHPADLRGGIGPYRPCAHGNIPGNNIQVYRQQYRLFGYADNGSNRRYHPHTGLSPSAGHIPAGAGPAYRNSRIYFHLMMVGIVTAPLEIEYFGKRR